MDNPVFKRKIYDKCTAAFIGSCTGSSSSRQQSASAKYDIYVRATQKEPAEGMAKLTSMLASAIEPIETKN